jgi:serine/threonine-protein kinase
MAVDSSRAFADALRKTPLLTPNQQAEMTRDLNGQPDVKVFARRLLERGWLTSFQVNQLFLGRGADLAVGSYLLLERLGEGGTGQVFKARHLHMNRVVAFKLIRKDLLADREIVGRFHREIQLISSLTHPNIVHAYDAGPIGDNYYLAMEYIEGTDLFRMVRQQGPLPLEQACEYIRQSAMGLQHIHERGLVHRDVKPSNLLVTSPQGGQAGGLVKILDLGLARLQRPVSGEMTRELTSNNPVTMGTLDYMAPEQALDFHQADIRADVYSLGCTFYYLLTGRPPFPEGTLTQKLLKHQQAEPAPVDQTRRDLPPAVTATLRKMMAKQRERRYQTPGEILRDLGGAPPIVTMRANLPVPLTGAPNALVVAQPLHGEVLDLSNGSRTRKIVPLLTSFSTLTLRAVSQKRRWPFVAGGGVALLCLVVLFMTLRSGGAPTSGSSQPAATGSASAPPTLPASAEPTFLSDMKDFNFQGVAFGKNGHLNHNGNNNLGGNSAETRIIVKGVISKKGLSTLAPSVGAASVCYHLNRQYSTFKSGVALHDGGWFSGSKITFTVMGDGKVLWQSKKIGAHDEYPQDCSVSVAGVDVLELQVTCTSSNNGVWPVWLDPRVSQ